MTCAKLSTVPSRLVPSGAPRVVPSGANRLVLLGAANSCYQAHATPIQPYSAGFMGDSNLSNRVFQTLSNAALRGAAVHKIAGGSAARRDDFKVFGRAIEGQFSRTMRP